ncbi:CLUMA_CG013483, isoform A [Clunio marinus]|uniref:CLUMA_CG013483, isoform A n=1 Tax=Clunio marinus TaxID=568069 RepID=A0A1J1INZ9_9DIPT|nr:CLUMA_CG013483, isoform A [Clunio marinus]
MEFSNRWSSGSFLIGKGKSMKIESLKKNLNILEENQRQLKELQSKLTITMKKERQSHIDDKYLNKMSVQKIGFWTKYGKAE